MTQSNVVVTGPIAAEGTYKNIVLKSGLGFEEQTREGYCIYHVKWNYDLGGAVVDIPANVVISMEGGVISNGTLVGHDTQIIYDVPVDKAFVNVELEGTWIDDDDKQDVRISELERISGNRAESTILPTHMGRVTLKPNIAKRSNYWFVYPYTYTQYGHEKTDNILVYFNNNKYYLPRRYADTTPVALVAAAQDIVGEIPFSAGANIEDVATALNLQSGQYLSYDDRTKVITMPDSSTVNAYELVNDNWPLKNYTETDANLLTQQMISKPNTIYVIQYDYELATDITVPANCVLEFDGGSISANGSNDTITGDNTILKPKEKIFDGIKINGTWNCSIIKSSMFKTETDADVAVQLVNLSSSNIFNTIILGESIFQVNVSGQYFSSGLWLKSNTKLIIQGTLKTIPNALQHCNTIIAHTQENIEICGGGIIMGDKDEHLGVEGEWGHGVAVLSSKNVYIHDVEVTNCYGDGIAISCATHASGPSTYCSIKNCNIHNILRNGISLGYVSDIDVLNCEIIDVYGKNPQAAIDIEPDDNNDYTKNISIRNVIANSCLHGIYVLNIHTNVVMDNISIDKCKFVCDNENALYISNNINNINISNCYFESLNTAKAATIINQEDRYFIGCSFIGNSAATGTLVDYSPVAATSTFISCTFYAPKADILLDASNTIFKACNISGGKLSVYNYVNCIVSDSTLNHVSLSGSSQENIKVVRCKISAKARILFSSDSENIVFENNVIMIDDSVESLDIFYIARVKYFTFKDNIIKNAGDADVSFIIQACDACRLENNPILGSSSVSDPTINNINSIFNFENKYVPSNGATRPTMGALYVGFCFFDTTLGKPIYWNGTAWVDATGTTV